MYHLGGYDPFGGWGGLPRSQLPLPFHLPLPPRHCLACSSCHRCSCPYPNPLPGHPQEVDEPKLSYLVRRPIGSAAPCHWPKLRWHGLVGYFVSQCLVASRHPQLLPTSPSDKPICTDYVPRLEICSPCRGFELVEPPDQPYNMMRIHCALPQMRIFEHPSPTQVRVLGVSPRPSVCSGVSLPRRGGWCSS